MTVRHTITYQLRAATTVSRKELAPVIPAGFIRAKQIFSYPPAGR